MSRYIGPKNRLSRREGLDLFGKGLKLRRANIPPGQHGQKGSRRLSDYGTRLREKQKMRRMYGIIERQFVGYFEKAKKVRGKTGEHLLRLLEMRLDNVVYRLGLAPTRAMARQIVVHGHILINDSKVSIPSYQTRVGEIVSVHKKLSSSPILKNRLDTLESGPPAWLERTGFVGKVVSVPRRDEIDSPINEQLIVEFYSR